TRRYRTGPFQLAATRRYTADTDIMRMPCQASTAATGRLVFELEAKGQDEGEDTLEERLAIAQQRKVGRFVSKIDSDGAVFAGPFGGLSHMSPLGHQASSADETRWGEHVAISRPLCRAQSVTTKSDGMWKNHDGIRSAATRHHYIQIYQ